MLESRQTVAQLLVECLENEGVQYVFGLPGEENVRFIDALDKSSIRFILVRSEQGAAFMAEIYGRLTGRAGVCAATLGPGAINLLLGVADAHLDSTPLVAISAHAGVNRVHKESHQSLDLVSMFKPATKWADMLLTPGSTAEMVRKAFKQAQSERPGAVYLAIPDDIEECAAPDGVRPLKVNVVHDTAPSESQIARAADVLKAARRPVVLAGHGAARNNASEALTCFAETLRLPVATTFMGKGVISDNHPNTLGAMGFMFHDHVNSVFEQADVIVTVGYDLQEFSPARINPQGNKQIIHIHRVPAEVDAHYEVAVGIQGHISASLDALAAAVPPFAEIQASALKVRHRRKNEFEEDRNDDSFPLKPQRIVAEIRAAMGPDDIVLVDTGALKMWMARLYPTFKPNTCLISNGLASMGFAVPGALAAKLAFPRRQILAATGDGAFMMNSQEIETALREKIPFVILIWEDCAYGLIKWKMELELGHWSHMTFTNPDFVKYAESFGATGYRITAANQLLPALKGALASDTVSVIACPVDYSENTKLTQKLAEMGG
ncbi:MAG TPA: acetolactate synthase large subunit [Terriglobia bacterium]|nr:acetolactate synthase large subunit [Terriglobia bacterium]